MRPVLETANRESQFPPQLLQILAPAVREFLARQHIPHPLVGIQIGGVAGQPFQVQPVGRSCLQEVRDCLTAMDRRPIPDHEELAGNLAQQLPQELYDCRAAEGALADFSGWVYAARFRVC